MQVNQIMVEEFEEKERELKQLKRALDTVVNFGVSAEMAENIVKKHKKSIRKF